MIRIGQLSIVENATGATVASGEARDALEPSLEAIRGRVRHADDGRYRPLSGETNLPTGWYVETGPTLPIEDAIDAVYPLAPVHRRQFAQGTLRLVTLDEVLTRQTGRYEGAASLSRAGRSLARQVLCGRCVRVPVWAGEPCNDSQIPCPEPCSVFVALAREAAAWESERPAQSTIDPAIPFAAFDEPGNEVREDYLRLMGTGANE